MPAILGAQISSRMAQSIITGGKKRKFCFDQEHHHVLAAKKTETVTKTGFPSCNTWNCIVLHANTRQLLSALTPSRSEPLSMV
jgi:hypothetical protein